MFETTCGKTIEWQESEPGQTLKVLNRTLGGPTHVTRVTDSQGRPVAPENCAGGKVMDGGVYRE